MIRFPATKMLIVLCMMATFAGCDRVETKREFDYYVGLGFDKTVAYLKECTAKRKALIDQHDAEGLDRYAKSIYAANCLTAVRYAIDAEKQRLESQYGAFDNAHTRKEVAQIREGIMNDFNTRWEGVDFETFGTDHTYLVPVATALQGITRRAASRESSIDFDNFAKPRGR